MDSTVQDLIDIIDKGFETGGRMDNDADDKCLADAVQRAIEMLDSGAARVAEQVDGDWQKKISSATAYVWYPTQLYVGVPTSRRMSCLCRVS